MSVGRRNSTLDYLPLSVIRADFRYDPDTGALMWRGNQAAGRDGDLATHAHPHGYLRTYHWNRQHLAHRVIMKLMIGEFDQSLCVDHIDGDKSNNAWANLRLATSGENRVNTRHIRANGLPRGVSHNGSGFRAVCGRDHLGTFPTVAQARARYEEAARLKWGEFVPT